MFRRINNITTVFIMFVVLLLKTGLSQDSLSFTVKEAQKYALENNYDVRNARLNIDVADKQRWEVTASGFPQVTISAQYQNLIDIPTQLIPGEFFGEPAGSTIPVKFGKPHNATYGISVSQLIFSGSYFVGLQASSIYLQFSEQNHRVTELQVQESVAQTCYLILVAEENRAILNTSLENLRKTHAEVSAMNQEGFTEDTDVKQLAIAVSSMENNISSLDLQIDNAYKLLKMQLGIDFDKKVKLKENLSELIGRTDVNDLLQHPFEKEENTSYKLLLTNQRLADLTLKNEMTGFLPTISAFGRMERNAQRDEFNFFNSDLDWFPTTVVGLQFSWPIFSGGQKIFKIQKAKIELKQAELQLKQAGQGLQLQYDKAQADLSTAYKKFKNSTKSRQLSEEIYETNLFKFKEGMLSSLDLIQSYNQYLQSQSEYMASESELLSAQNTLDKLLENY
ncbi:MAG: TolC family protein [Calditrichaeota bacterium]|nr:TolC family protein [Calditrichota bacterium]